ncbi:hypothetical protein MTP99_016727 [Tenebrio molitor]|nr:hypothetical protein MTP99_016727 [Tenebrio molitor]
MEDLSDILKKHFFGLYKKRNEAFETVQERVVKMNEQRKTNRHDAVFAKRKIPTDMSPVAATPRHEKTPPKRPQPVNKRLEMLAKWKADKDKRKEIQKRKTKPIFKVSHVPVTVGLPNLENVNTEIKGVPFKSKFAPPNHKFRPPANIKPVQLQSTKGSVGLIGENRDKTDGASVKHRMTTRSQARSVSSNSVFENNRKNKEPVAKTKTQRRGKKENKEEPCVNKQEPSESSKCEEAENVPLMSPDFPVENNETSSESQDVTTPKKQEPPVYVSPFVTMSRGKNSARKEYESRKLRKTFSSTPNKPDYTSPKAGAAYFTWLLDNQISRLQEVCRQWTTYKDEQELPEEAVAMIDVALGQTNLLISKKFVQFRGLIDKSKDEDAENAVTCEDLHGFWDMMHLQVDNLDKRFENLEKLRANNWEEVVCEVKKKAVKKKGRPLKNAKASNGLREAIQAARRKKEIAAENVASLEIVAGQKTPSHESSRLLSVKTSGNKHRHSSPGLMMMKIAQYAKSVETPAKSILKTDPLKSAKSQSKTVFFQDDVNKSIENIENSFNISNLQHREKTPRRSSRLSKSKLF